MSDSFPKPPQMPDLHKAMQDIEKAKAENANRLAGRYDAAEIFKYLMERVDQHQQSLSPDEEIGIRLANFGEAAELHIRKIRYKNPNLIEFQGVNADGHNATLVQHISQLNFLLVAVKPIEDEPYRIGFL